MENYDSPGLSTELTAPAGGVVSGQAYLIGSLVVVATETKDAAETFRGLVKGVVDLAKVPSEVWTENLKLYWDDAAGLVTLDDASAANPIVGVALPPFNVADVELDFVDTLGSGGLTIDGLEITIVDYLDLAGGIVSVDVNGTVTTLTEEDSGDWEAATGNDETAESLAAAISAIDGVTAAADGAVVTVTPGTGVVGSNPAVGRVRLDGVAR